MKDYERTMNDMNASETDRDNAEEFFEGAEIRMHDIENDMEDAFCDLDPEECYKEGYDEGNEKGYKKGYERGFSDGKIYYL